MIGWMLDLLGDVRHDRQLRLGPLVVISRREQNAREASAFKLGRLVEGGDYVRASNNVPPRL